MSSDLPPETIGVLGTLLGAGGVGAWLRERRKGKRDAQDFALELIAAQNARIDGLMFQVGELSGRVTQLSDLNATLATDKIALQTEITRLRTALQTEAERATALALAAASRQGDAPDRSTPSAT